MQPMSIPNWKWDNISMYFIVGMPRTAKGCDLIWVIVYRLTKLTHFISINITYPWKKLSDIYRGEIMRLHGIPSNIVSNRDLRFISRFWESLQKYTGTKLRFSYAYYLQIDGLTKMTI